MADDAATKYKNNTKKKGDRGAPSGGTAAMAVATVQKKEI